jgi:UDP-glucuronate decarboxylase
MLQLMNVEKTIMKTILVTGGAGFLGNHLCRKLISSGNKVICLDNLSTGNIGNISDLLENENFTFVKDDICNPINLQSAVDEIYNLACPASPKYYQLASIETMKANVIGALNILTFAKDKKAKVLQASTSEIYGEPTIHPQKEEYLGSVNTIGPRSCYNEGKRCAESLFFDYKRKYGLIIKVARIFNTYGPNMHVDDGRVITNLILQSLKNESLTINGDGTQTRSFCYVDDLIIGLISFMNTEDEFSGPMNLGNDEEITIYELSKKIIRLTKSKSKITFCRSLSDDPSRRCPDISLANRVMNWRPQVGLEVGLAKTIAHYEFLTSPNELETSLIER